jgi:hypothetical protein
MLFVRSIRVYRDREQLKLSGKALGCGLPGQRKLAARPTDKGPNSEPDDGVRNRDAFCEIVCAFPERH